MDFIYVFIRVVTNSCFCDVNRILDVKSSFTVISSDVGLTSTVRLHNKHGIGTILNEIRLGTATDNRILIC